MLFWWWQAKLLQPKVTICSTLARYQNSDGRAQCEVKLVNHGHRSAADLSVKIQLVVPGLINPGANQVFDLRDEHLPWLSPKEDWYYLIAPDQLSDSDKRTYETIFLTNFRVPLSDELDMRKLLESCKGASVKVFVAANDAFSGAKAFSKQSFGARDFRDGEFREGDTCNHTGQYKAVQANERGD